MKKTSFILLCLFVFFNAGFTQTRFSLSTDFNGVRSFKKNQRFLTVGQTLTAQFHFTPTDGAYFSLGYSAKGKFSNELAAAAKDPLTIPQQVGYRNRAELDFKHISTGWKHFFKGNSIVETGWNLYGLAGFGLMMGRVINTHSISVDTATYALPVLAGKANFKRLTWDLGLGGELALPANVYLYLETRLLIPTTDYPSPYIFTNDNAPLIGTVGLGFRILF